jgi:histone H3/H4
MDEEQIKFEEKIDLSDKRKKKKIRFFDSYIYKALKQVSQNEITNNAKQQMNNILIIITKLISEKALFLTESVKKKTCGYKEIESVIKVMFEGDLQGMMIEEGLKSIQVYKDNEEIDEKKGISRQSKAGILFPASICEKFLRKFGNSNIMITGECPIFLASALEYFTAEILDLASSISSGNNHIRITVRDITLAIQNDYELSTFFKKWNINFLGGGILPFINQALLTHKKNQKDVSKCNAIKEIKRLQKQGDYLIFPRHPFEQVIRSICNSYRSDIKISKFIFILLQYYIEQELVNLLQKANNLAIYSGRIKVLPSDFEMVISITENRLPNFLEKKD